MRVYVHGNCQAPAIAMLLAEAFPDWSIASYEVFTDKIIDEIEHYRDSVSRADIIVSQPIHEGYRGREDLSLSWIRANAKPGAPVVVFPSMFFDGQLVGWRSVSVQGYGMPYQDMLVLHCVALGLDALRIVSIVSNEEIYSSDFIEQEIGLSIAEMQRREVTDGIDVPLSPFLLKYGRNTRLFHVINHPHRQALAYVTNCILERFGYGQPVSFLGGECIPFPHVPLPAPVQRFLRLQRGGIPEWDVPEPHKYHLPTARLTRAEYVLRVVDHLRTHPRNELLDRLREPHVLPFLQRLAAAAPAIPGIEIWRKAAE